MAVYTRTVPEVEVHRERGALRVVAPTACAAADFGNFVAVSVVVLLGAAIAVGGVLMSQAPGALDEAVRSLDDSPWHASALLIGLAAGWVLALAGLAVLPLEMAAGVEMVEIDASRVLIRRNVGPVRWTQVVTMDRIAGVRDVEPPRSWRFKLLSYRPMWRGHHGRLELELRDGGRVRFGTVDAGTNLRLFRGAINRAISEALAERTGPAGAGESAAAARTPAVARAQ